MEKDFKWYAVQVRGNKEKAVKERLEKEIEKHGYQDHFNRIYIPIITITNEKTNKKSLSPLLKGIMFINCELTYKLQGLILNQLDIFGFLGGKPSVIPTKQLTQMINETGCTDFEGNFVTPKKFKIGDEVTIKETNFKGTITEFCENETKAMVSIKIFNKIMQIEAEISQLKNN